MPRRNLTASDHARRLHARDPSLTLSQIATMVAQVTERPCSRQLVAEAIAASPKRGRPAKSARVVLTLPAELLPRLDAWVERDGYDGRAEAILAAVSSALLDQRAAGG